MNFQTNERMKRSINRLLKKLRDICTVNTDSQVVADHEVLTLMKMLTIWF